MNRLQSVSLPCLILVTIILLFLHGCECSWQAEFGPSDELLERVRLAENGPASSVEPSQAANQLNANPPYMSFKKEVERKFQEQERKFQEQQQKIDVLLEQYKALTTQLTDFFAKSATTKNIDAARSRHSGDEQVNVLNIDATGGVTYVRWGRTECSDNNILYRGFAGTSPYNQTGGAGDFICLHSNPFLDQTKLTGVVAAVSGVEYAGASDPFSTENNYGQSLSRNDMPCVVCHVQTRSTQLMIPGRNDCPAGWTLEYWGFLMSSYYGHVKSSSFLCVDRAPETVPGGSAATVAGIVYPVEAKCGLAMPCPPYFAGYGTACAVCSK